MIKLTNTPVINTTNKLGSHFLLSSKNPYILSLWVIPANIRPNPKIIPIMKKTTVEIDFLNDLLNLLENEIINKIKGITTAPIIK